MNISSYPDVAIKFRRDGHTWVSYKSASIDTLEEVAVKTEDTFFREEGNKPSEDNGEFTIYPNPSGQNIYLNGPITGMHVRIYDLRGKLMTKTDNYNNDEPINISLLPEGMYIVHVFNTDMSIVMVNRFVVSNH